MISLITNMSIFVDLGSFFFFFFPIVLLKMLIEYVFGASAVLGRGI